MDKWSVEQKLVRVVESQPGSPVGIQDDKPSRPKRLCHRPAISAVEVSRSRQEDAVLNRYEVAPCTVTQMTADAPDPDPGPGPGPCSRVP